MRYKRLGAAALAVLAAAGCTNIAASPAPQLSFENYPPVSLNVATTNVEEAYILPNDKQDVSGQFVVSPTDAVKRYAARRFQASGVPGGYFTIAIEDARVHFRQIAQDNKALQWADIGTEDEYRVFLQLRVTPQPDGFSGRPGPITIKMERTLVMKSGVTLKVREDKQIAFLEKLIADVDGKIQVALDDVPAIR
ncbi:MAG TPA: hypothetical protein VFS88_08160 [Micavibrio sp.]|nr:hypothetical protein [Micavibrio sp.]